MKFNQKKFQLQLGGFLVVGLGIAYYLLLVVTVGEFATLFKGLEVENFPVHTSFILWLSDYWWVFSLMAAAGAAAMHLLKPKVGYIFYCIPLVLLPILVIVTIWAMYSPVFSMSESF